MALDGERRQDLERTTFLAAGEDEKATLQDGSTKTVWIAIKK